MPLLDDESLTAPAGFKTFRGTVRDKFDYYEGTKVEIALAESKLSKIIPSQKHHRVMQSQ